MRIRFLFSRWAFLWIWCVSIFLKELPDVMSMKNTYADIPNLLFSAATISIGLMASIHLLVIYKTDSRGIIM
jgi:hypothetical protein